MNPGWPQFLGAWCFSAIGTYFTARTLTLRLNRPLNAPFFLSAIALLALVSIADDAFILTKQAWPYLRPPIQSDLERHLILIKALVRRTGSPFLPHSSFLFQLIWDQMAAVFFVPFNPSISFEWLKGFVLFTGFLLYFFLYWAAFLIRPALLLNRKALALLGLFLLLHSDAFNLVLSFLVNGHAGIEADWSFVEPLFFRNFSVKFLVLTCPHHAFFFLFASLFLVLLRREKKLLNGWGGFTLFLFAFLSSPLFTAVLFVPFYLYLHICETKEHSPWLRVAGRNFLLGGIVYFFVNGYSAHLLVFRPGATQWAFLSALPWQWLALPTVLIGNLGIQGILLSGLILFCLFKRSDRFWGSYSALFLVGGSLCFFYLATDPEVRRHFSILSSGVALFALLDLIPRGRKWLNRSAIQVPLAVMALMGIGIHGYFLYAYVGKETILSKEIAWNDYFAMNEALEKIYPAMPIIAAVDSEGLGLSFPLAMRVTSSFASALDATVHTRINMRQEDLLRRTERAGSVAPYGELLGYQAILWGPVEKRVWGERVKKRFIREDKLLVRMGDVGLYELQDQLKARFDKDANPKDPKFYLKVSRAFSDEGWLSEGLEFAVQAVALAPENTEMKTQLSRMQAKVAAHLNGQE